MSEVSGLFRNEECAPNAFAAAFAEADQEIGKRLFGDRGLGDLEGQRGTCVDRC